jgi:hypothetical protein
MPPVLVSAKVVCCIVPKPVELCVSYVCVTLFRRWRWGSVVDCVDFVLFTVWSIGLHYSAWWEQHGGSSLSLGGERACGSGV